MTSPHRLIIGRSLSGKSGLAKQIGSELRLKGYEVIAFNPIRERGYACEDDYNCIAAEWDTFDPDEFVEEAERRRALHDKPIFLIIDEAHEFFTRAKCEHLWLGTRGRHYGYNIIAITQTGASINKTFRGQCSQIYLFACSLSDAKFMGDELGKKELYEAPSLKQGECFKVSFDKVEKICIF